MLRMQTNEEQFIEQELTFSEVDELRKMAFETINGLMSLCHFGPKDEYWDEVAKGLEFCRRFRQGYALAKMTTLISAADLPLWQGFQKILSKASAEKIDLGTLINKVSKLEENLSSILQKKNVLDTDNLSTAQRLLLDTVKVLW